MLVKVFGVVPNSLVSIRVFGIVVTLIVMKGLLVCGDRLWMFCVSSFLLVLASLWINIVVSSCVV